jgi:hypothetical protein
MDAQVGARSNNNPLSNAHLLCMTEVPQQQWKQLLLLLSQVLAQRGVNLLRLAHQLLHETGALLYCLPKRRVQQLRQLLEQALLHRGGHTPVGKGFHDAPLSLFAKNRQKAHLVFMLHAVRQGHILDLGIECRVHNLCRATWQ